jgi:hypothetical protein
VPTAEEVHSLAVSDVTLPMTMTYCLANVLDGGRAGVPCCAAILCSPPASAARLRSQHAARAGARRAPAAAPAAGYADRGLGSSGIKLPAGSILLGVLRFVRVGWAAAAAGSIQLAS